MVTATETSTRPPGPHKTPKIARALLATAIALPLSLAAVDPPPTAHGLVIAPPDATVARPAAAPQADPIFAHARYGLSPAEADRYARIFDAADRRDWAAVDAMIPGIGDRRLLGHVLAARHLAPGSPASFADLRGWLDLYGDLPEAEAIYRLALARQPDADTTTLPAPHASSVAAGPIGDADLVGAAEPPTSAATQAFSRFIAQDDKGARGAALRAIAALGERASTSRWIAGLASWRLGDMVAAERHFAALANANSASGWLRAAGAYWAGRVAERTETTASARRWFSEAGRYPTTFYGLLAMRKLGVDLAGSVSGEALRPEHLDRLAQTPAGYRAIALLQLGRRALAARELERIDTAGDPMIEEAVIVLAQARHLGDLAPGLAQRIARPAHLVGDDTTARFPIPGWQPRGGFRIDPALVYAVARQESGFHADALSPAGAAGLMQLMPGTAGKMAGVRGAGSLLDPATNLELGQRLIGTLMRDPNIGENLLLLAAAYNGGSGNPAKLARILEHDDPLLAIESLPKEQTREFIHRVLANYWIYRARLGADTASLTDLADGKWPLYRWEQLGSGQAGER
jgi:soluble lytic murein transglycosylase-like protein